MKNKRLFQQRLETLDAIFSGIKNGIQMGASVGELNQLDVKYMVKMCEVFALA